MNHPWPPHRLRQGELTSTGHRIFGYDYRRKTPTSPAALVINETQAAIVRSIFEMFATFEFTKNYKFIIIDRENVWAKAMNRVVNEKVLVDKAVDEMIARIRQIAR